MNKNQHPNAAEALLNWTLTRADGRIVVQHSSGAFYAASKEGSGIAESILYMLADSLLSATLSPAHIVDGEEVEVVGYRSGTSGHVYTEGYGLERPEPLMTVAQHQRIKAALSADNQRVLPPEPILAAPHPMAALSAPPASERQQAAGCKCVYATAKNTAAVRNGSEMGGYLKAECVACQQRRQSRPASEQQEAVVMSAAAADILAERQRQIGVEDFDAAHDDMATGGQLGDAAACYALWAGGINPGNWYQFWPWAREWLKHSNPRRMLVKAGALILAEIERLDRKHQSSPREGEQ